MSAPEIADRLRLGRNGRGEWRAACHNPGGAWPSDAAAPDPRALAYPPPAGREPRKAKNQPLNQDHRDHRLDFGATNRAALAVLPALLARWLPDGRPEGQEFVARNPRRADRNTGSFKVNLRTGRWADFATGDRGGDPISLAAYLFGLRQAEAARRLADMLGLPSAEVRR